MKIRILSLILMVVAVALPQTINAQELESDSLNEQEYREAVDSFLSVCGAKLTIVKQFPAFLQILKNITELPDEVFSKIETKFRERFVDEQTDIITSIYKKHFTLDELRQYIAFYNTPLGKKVASVTPSIQKESLDLGQEIGANIAIEIIEELKAEGYEIDSPEMPQEQ